MDYGPYGNPYTGLPKKVQDSLRNSNKNNTGDPTLELPPVKATAKQTHFTPVEQMDVDDWVLEEIGRIEGLTILYCEPRSGLLMVGALLRSFGVVVAGLVLAYLSTQRPDSSTLIYLIGPAVIILGLMLPVREYYRWRRSRLIISRMPNGNSTLHFVSNIPTWLKLVFGDSVKDEIPIRQLLQKGFKQGFLESLFDVVSFKGDSAALLDTWVQHLQWIRNAKYFTACMSWIRANG